MFRKDCFAYHKYKTGFVKCNALKVICCDGCNFYRTKSDYSKNVAPLKYKKKEVVKNDL